MSVIWAYCLSVIWAYCLINDCSQSTIICKPLLRGFYSTSRIKQLMVYFGGSSTVTGNVRAAGLSVHNTINQHDIKNKVP